MSLDLAKDIVSASGSNPCGHTQVNSNGRIAANRIQELTILLPSPT